MQHAKMAYRRGSQHGGWPRWIREHRAELCACGLPPEAYKTEMDWFLFLDHGYVQSHDQHTSDWWSINTLGAEQAQRLRGLLAREYGDRYPDLLRSLQSLAAGSTGQC
jgi:hypothetical protein